MDRRTFIQVGVGAAIGGGILSLSPRRTRRQSVLTRSPPAYSVIPVVGDGKWIWNEPPKGETGYLEPRSYRLKVGIEIEGRGAAGRVLSTTSVPVECPEQKIDEENIQTQGCQARIRQLGPYGRQLMLHAPQIAKGQVVSAVAHYRLTLYKQYHGYRLD